MRRFFFTSTNKRAFKDKTCRVLLRNQFQVLNRKKLANDYNYRVSFMRFANQYYRLNKNNELKKIHRILPVQAYYFRKRFASMSIMMGIVEFIFFNFLIIFKVCTYILTLTYIFFSLTKYVVHPVANYMLYQKTSKNPQYSEYLNTLYDRLNFVINCSNDNAKVTDFFDMYLSEQTKKEIEDFDLPRGKHDYPLINTPIMLDIDSKFGPNTTRFYEIMSEKKNEPLPKVRTGEKPKQYKYRLNSAKKAKYEFKKLVRQLDQDAINYMTKLSAISFQLQNSGSYLVDDVSATVDMLNPFDRIDLVNKNKKYHQYVTYPPQLNNDVLNDVYRSYKGKFPALFLEENLNKLYNFCMRKIGRNVTIMSGTESNKFRPLTYGQHRTVYAEDGHHVFFVDSEFDKTYRKNQEEQCLIDKKKQYLKEKYSYLLQHNKKIRDLYNNHAFDQIIEELWTADSGNLNDLLYGPTNWGTIDAETTIFNEKGLYPFMPFFGDHDTDAYLSRYIFNDLYFHNIIRADENYLNKIVERRLCRNKYFQDSYFYRGYRYEKNLYYKPKNIINKKKKETVFKNIDYCGSYFLQLDFENFLLYLYYSLKEENNPIIILIDKFITIFF